MARPSGDEEARLRLLTYQGLGAMLVQFLIMPGLSPEEFVGFLWPCSAGLRGWRSP